MWASPSRDPIQPVLFEQQIDGLLAQGLRRALQMPINPHAEIV
jgi:hypothetical protein